MLPHQSNQSKIQLPSEDQLDRMLSKVKIKLFYHKGAAFLSSIMCTLTFHWDENITTACTNGKQIRWNPYFFVSIPIEERVFVLAHELWHVAYQHCLRLGGRDPFWHNIAADHVINTKLINHGYSISKLGFKIYQDQKYNDWSVDRVYEDLTKNLTNIDINKLIAEYGMADDIKEGDQGGLNDSIATIVRAIQASKMAGEAGVVPGEIEETINEYLNPILPWEILLQNFLTELSQEDYSYRKPSRRYDDPLMPSLWSEGQLQEMNWYVDVSGSIYDSMLQRFFSEMKYVKETFYPGKINIIQFDCKIQHVLELTDQDDFSEFKVVGRGGTELKPVYDHIQKTKPSAAVIFSDMECKPMQEVSIPVLWAVFCANGKTPSKYAHEPTFGTIIGVIE